MRRVFIPEMTWTEIHEVLPQVQVGVIPTGSTEQHGPHLPLQSDIAFCTYLCRKGAEAAYPTTLVTTPVAIGISTHHMRFAGTLSFTPETFVTIIYEIAQSLHHHGIPKVVIVNGHGGNHDAIKIAARKIYDNLNMTAASCSYWELLPEDIAKQTLETYPTVPGHSCEFELSLSYVIQPELIRKNLIPDSDRIQLTKYQKLMAKRSTDVCTQGVPVGDPRVASEAKGEHLITSLVDELKGFFLYYAHHGDEIQLGNG